jgi:hypothetical protein
MLFITFSTNVCVFCDKKFDTLRQLDLHVSWHTTIQVDANDDIEVLVDFSKGENNEKGYVHSYFWVSLISIER